MSEALEPFPEIMSLGRDRLQRLCQLWCGEPQAKECGVVAVDVSADSRRLDPVFQVDAQGYDKGDALHFPFDRLLTFIIDQGCTEGEKPKLKERLRALRQKAGPYLFQRYRANVQAFTLAAQCSTCTHLMLTNIRVFKGQIYKWTGNEECTCPQCSTDMAVTPENAFLVIDPAYTRVE